MEIRKAIYTIKLKKFISQFISPKSRFSSGKLLETASFLKLFTSGSVIF